MVTGAGTHVIVALSGGVDSAVAALRLRQAGYRVQGLHMTNWEDAGPHCTAGRDLAEARLVAAELDIPLHHVRFEGEYRERVFAAFLQQYSAGRTPNPDIGCNRHIKFGLLREHALRLGADWLATGHYARIEHAPEPQLLQAVDADKDQSYFLHAVPAAALRQVMFPLGGLTKAQVRRLAADFGLSNHARKDSTGICFIGKRPFRAFLAGYLPAEPGPILTPDGRSLGEHRGLPYYTLGQREGLGVGGQPGPDGAPWYVAAKDSARNALIVVQGHDHPLLFSQGVISHRPHWIGSPPAAVSRGETLSCMARVRHRQPLAHCRVKGRADGGIEVHFSAAVRAATPGQSVVLYVGPRCLGGGEIDALLPVSPGHVAHCALTGTA